MAEVPLSEAAWRELVVAKLGSTETTAVAGLIASFWAQYPQYRGYRRALAVTADVLTALIGQLLCRLEDDSITAEQVSAVRTALQIREAQRAAVTTALATLGREGPGNGLRVGHLRATAPIPSPTHRPDANSSRWRGDPNQGAPGPWPW